MERADGAVLVPESLLRVTGRLRPLLNATRADSSAAAQDVLRSVLVDARTRPSPRCRAPIVRRPRRPEPAGPTSSSDRVGGDFASRRIRSVSDARDLRLWLVVGPRVHAEIATSPRGREVGAHPPRSPRLRSRTFFSVKEGALAVISPAEGSFRTPVLGHIGAFAVSCPATGTGALHRGCFLGVTSSGDAVAGIGCLTLAPEPSPRRGRMTRGGARRCVESS